MSTWDDLIADLGVWKRDGVRAVHKPLLVLHLLARAQRGDSNRVAYSEIDKSMRECLHEFGPPRKSLHPEFPFWYLQNDGFWNIEVPKDLRFRKGKSQPTSRELLSKDVHGSVPLDLWEALRRKRDTIPRLAQRILDEFWPETFHQPILDMIGLQLSVTSKLPRDPRFRKEVIRAYEGRCVICGYDGRLGTAPFGLDAAHIQWHAEGGPSEVSNGLALCSIHHVGFDRGAISVNDDRCLLVSQDLRGQETVRSLFIELSGASIAEPLARKYKPKPEYFDWHRKNVFREPAREIESRFLQAAEESRNAGWIK